MFTRTKAFIAATAMVVPFLVPTSVSAATGPTEQCSGTYVGAWPGVQFDSLVSTIAAVHVWIDQSVSTAASVPAGEYTIEAATYDGSIGRETDGVQENEQLFLEFLDAQGDVIASTGSTPDLADEVAEAEWRGSVGSVVLDRDAVTVRATHSFAGQVVGSPQHVHSVMPSCFAATLVPPTTTTTTTTSTTTTSTTTSTTTTTSEPPSTTSEPPSTTSEPPSTTSEPPASTTSTTTTTTTTTTVPTQVLPRVQEMPDPDPVVGDPSFTG